MHAARSAQRSGHCAQADNARFGGGVGAGQVLDTAARERANDHHLSRCRMRFGGLTGAALARNAPFLIASKRSSRLVGGSRRKFKLLARRDREAGKKMCRGQLFASGALQLLHA